MKGMKFVKRSLKLGFDPLVSAFGMLNFVDRQSMPTSEPESDLALGCEAAERRPEDGCKYVAVT